MSQLNPPPFKDPVDQGSRGGLMSTWHAWFSQLFVWLQTLAANNTVVSVKDFGAVGDGVTDDTAAIQAAHDAAQGKRLFFLKGKYKLTSTITNTYTNSIWIGECAGRYTDGGTEIASSALVLFKNGVDNGHAWEQGDYDGPQGMVFQDLWFSNSAPDTNLAGGGAGGSVQQYMANSYAIQDWRGGSVQLRGQVGFERFDYSFWGINSDINTFEEVYQLYCKHGIYAGPLSNQFTINKFYPIYCDTALIVDGATSVRIHNPQIVDCGHATAYAVEIRCGSGQVVIENSPWFEHLNGYQGTDQLAFVGVGMTKGWAGTTGAGAQTATAPVAGVVIRNPFIYTTVAGVACHTKNLCDVGNVLDLFIDSPQTAVGNSMNLDYYFNLNNTPPTAHLTTNTTAFAKIHQRDITKLYSSFTGTPEVGYETFGYSARSVGSLTGRWNMDCIGASAGADRLTVGTEGVVGGLYFTQPNIPAAYQSDRLRLFNSVQSGNAAPVSGNYKQGDVILNSAPNAQSADMWKCVTSGTPGTWVANKSAGTFTIAAASSLVVSDVNITASSVITLQPYNAAAATVDGSAAHLYISARTAGTSFSVSTGDATAQSGQWGYVITN